MQTIGGQLEEARQRKGISLREAAEATKVRSDFLATSSRTRWILTCRIFTSEVS